MSFQSLKRFVPRYLSYTKLHYTYSFPTQIKSYSILRYKSSNVDPFDKDKDESIPRYSKKQIAIQYFVYALMLSISAGTICFLYSFRKYYVKPRNEYFKEDGYPLPSKTRDRMIKDMANKFLENMEFKTHKNELIKGMDVLSDRKFFILYCGYPDCNDKCTGILKSIKASLMSKQLQKYKELLSILYIDLNMFDSPQKLNEYFINILDIKPDIESNVDIVGLIPQNRETLREVMDSFCVYIYKRSGHGKDMELDHSNIVYFVDKDGLLYEILGGEYDVINEENIIDRTNKLLYHSESTMLGKMRNTLSLIFQTSTIRQMPDRHTKGQSVPSSVG